MKSIIATAGCALVIGLSSTFAQQDSTRDREQSRRTKQPNETNRTRNQQTDEARRSTNNSTDYKQTNKNSTDQGQNSNKREMVIVQPSEVPSSLRETLADPKYQGWENAVIYHNTRTGEYLVSPRPHRFSSEGKELGYSMSGDRNGNKSYGNNESQNRSNGSLNQHRRTSDNSTSGNNQNSDSDKSNTYSTNPNQDSTRTNGRESSSQGREQSGQSSSYRRDSTQMNNTDSNNSQQGSRNSQNMNSDRSRSDSSRTNSSANNSNASSGTSSSNNSYTGSRVEDQNLPTEGMVLVEEQDVPAKLKATLRDSDYSGWERGKLYQNPATGEYILVMCGSESGSDEQRSYRFDKDGKMIKDSKMNGRGQE
jgi:hypothetical protein